MATVAFLKGVNVGGHRHFRPTVLAAQLRRFDVINIGSTGTFVVLKPVDAHNLCADISSQLPFEVEIMVCNGRDIRRLVRGRHGYAQITFDYISAQASSRE